VPIDSVVMSDAGGCQVKHDCFDAIESAAILLGHCSFLR